MAPHRRDRDVAISDHIPAPPLALHLNDRDPHGRLVCPLCGRGIRVSEDTEDDGIYLRHSECRNRIVWAQWQEGRTVKVLVRPRDWEDAKWRERFEADLLRTGWRLISVEPPAADRLEYVYILAPESNRTN